MAERIPFTTPAKGIFKDRGSKFLSFAEPIKDEEHAKERIKWYKKKYHDARHVCYAYRLGEDLWRTKDDGEPHGTAGMPILRSIDAKNLDNILVVVVRYFGGTLLGTSGLIQAYKTSAAEAIAAATIEERIVEKTFVSKFGYQDLNAVMRIMKDFDLAIVNQIQEMDCTLYFRIRLGDIERVRDRFDKLDFVSFEEEIVESEES